MNEKITESEAIELLNDPKVMESLRMLADAAHKCVSGMVEEISKLSRSIIEEYTELFQSVEQAWEEIQKVVEEARYVEPPDPLPRPPKYVGPMNYNQPMKHIARVARSHPHIKKRCTQ